MNWSVRPHMSPRPLQPPRCSRSGNSEISTTDSAAGGGMNLTVRRPAADGSAMDGVGTENMAKVAKRDQKMNFSPFLSLFFPFLV